MKTEGNRFAFYLTKYCLIVLGCVIYAVGFQFFCYPNAITTGGNTTLVRDDGTSVTGERIDDEANPLAAPTQGDGKEDGTNPDGTDSNAIDTGKIAGIPIGILVGLVSGIIAALAAFLLINRKKDEEGGANEQ